MLNFNEATILVNLYYLLNRNQNLFYMYKLNKLQILNNSITKYSFKG